MLYVQCVHLYIQAIYMEYILLHQYTNTQAVFSFIFDC